MGHYSHGILAALYCWIIFNNLNPGLAADPVLRIKPDPQDAGTSDALISYNTTNRAGYYSWVTSLSTFLSAYRSAGRVQHGGSNIYSCDYIATPPPGGVCDIDIRGWGSCIEENYFGYHRESPCVFLKLETPPGWKPEYYNDSNSLPAAMPSDLKSYIVNLATTNVPALNTVWVTCEGEYPADLEFIGPIAYYPGRGFPGYLLLNNDREGYLSPLVAVHIERPSRGILINIKCKAWARNIDNDSAQGVGKFSLMIN